LDAATPPENRSKLQRYRWVVLAVVGIPTALFAILVSASIVIELFATRAGAAPARPGAAEQLACNEAVRELLDRLVREAARMEMVPLDGKVEDLAKAWDGFSVAWDDDWRAAERRCGFDELAESGLGVAFDRVARVHGSLPATKLKYAEQMARFTQDLAAEVAEMRSALDKSHADLVERSAGNKDKTDE
jgi:hypothetical protein